MKHYTAWQVKFRQYSPYTRTCFNKCIEKLQQHRGRNVELSIVGNKSGTLSREL